jgi:hypothetical protein
LPARLDINDLPSLSRVTKYRAWTLLGHFRKEAGGRVGLVTVSLELGALKKGKKIGTVLLASGNGACLHLR